jgi:transcriptional regulator GlxA family with amidase domain
VHIIIYMSRFTRILDDDELASLFDTAAEKNRKAGITSVLLHDSRRLIQAIEGKRDTIATLMATLESDPRHHQISLVHRSAIQARQFDPWHMRAARLDPGQSLAKLRVQAADLLTSTTQVPVKAAFFGFCRYSAKAIPV